LPDYRVPGPGHTGVAYGLRNVSKASSVAVDQVLALAGAVETADELDLAALNREPGGAIVEHQPCLGHSGGPPALRPREDDVFGPAASQIAHRLLAQNPAQGIDEVTFAAAVRADDCRYPFGELNTRKRRERLESGDVQGL
jgi:hypothetical protein